MSKVGNSADQRHRRRHPCLFHRAALRPAGQNRTILDWHKLASHVRTVWELFPIMHGAPIIRSWAGIEARMPDDLPVFGRSAWHESVYHQFGFSADGFQLGPGAGAVMAEIIATGRPNVPIAALGVDRVGLPA